MARFTKALRQEIVREFTTRHGGMYDPEAFVAEVRRKGAAHPAYEWFEWDDAKAASDYRLDQARAFVSDLRVTFKVELVGRNQAITVREVAAPFALSPLGNRRGGGGYVITDPTDPDHMTELCHQAARDLEAWLRRYSAAVLHAGGNVQSVERQVAALVAVGMHEEAA